MPLAAYLATLSAERLAALLERRPDVLVEPAPRDLSELAAALNGVASLRAAVHDLDADEVSVVRALGVSEGRAVSGAAAGPVIARLAARGLAWPSGAGHAVPRLLLQALGADLSRFRRAELIAAEGAAHSVRQMVTTLSGETPGSKAQAVVRLVELLSDPRVVRRAVDALPDVADRYLRQALDGSLLVFPGPGTPATMLVAAGVLMQGRYGRAELPREIAAVLLGGDPTITGRPEVVASTERPDDGRAAAEAVVHAVTALLDEAAAAPLVALKKGGVGVRERARVRRRLGDGDPALAIDIAAALGLLTPTSGGYAPTEGFAEWRGQPVAARWAAIAQAWFGLEWCPTDRETDDGEVAPPLALRSAAGMIRRGLLRAASGGRSIDGAAAAIGWYCPLLPDDPDWLGGTIATVHREAQLMGVAAGDRLTALGERLAGAGDLAAEVAPLMPEPASTLVLQSDLSAVVAGTVCAAAARVLAAAAEPESTGAVVTWRFSSTSVRAALDAGWSPEQLRAELRTVSGRDLPQPLDYLIGDVARRHGVVRVRETRCCITGPEPDISEILHTRSLAKLDLRLLAPTVLSSSTDPHTLLSALRKAGFAPVPEDGDGAIITATRKPPGAGRTPPRRPRIPAATLAARLRGDDEPPGRAREASRSAGKVISPGR